MGIFPMLKPSANGEQEKKSLFKALCENIIRRYQEENINHEGHEEHEVRSLTYPNPS